ncbi:MAG: lysylphosphatidylglycerol synthase domain-containing protein [Saprospiraceae bacterium]
MALPKPIWKQLRSPTHYYWLIALQGVLTLVLLVVLYRLVSAHPNLRASWDSLKTHLNQASWASMLLPVLLLLPNWLLETAKWRLLVRITHPIPFLTAFRAVLIGVGFSIITPQRVGEYGGRLILLPPDARWAGINAKIAGNAAQVLILVGFGGPAAILLGIQMGLLNLLLVICISAAFTLLFTLALYFFFRPALLKKMILARHWPDWIKQRLRPVGSLFHFPVSALAHVLLLSLMRYAIYCCQYILLLNLFNIMPGPTDACIGVAAIFFWQTMLPLTTVAGLAVRGNLAVWIWGFYGADAVNSLGASLFLWIINLILPALIGTLIFFRVQLTK